MTASTEPTESSEPAEARAAGVDAGRGLLMIAAAFPPTGGGGVQRVAKFAKFLPAWDWRPRVWTVDVMDGLPRDESLLADIPESVVVHRRRRGFLLDALGGLASWSEAGRVGSGIAASIAWRLQRWVAARSFPDPYATWAARSVAPLVRLAGRGAFDAILSSYSPASNHLLGWMLAARTGLPWIADFRDLWTEDYRYTAPDESRRRADRQLEQRILERADGVIGVTAAQTDLLAERVPDQREKFTTITNGFDPEDFSRAAAARPWAERRFVLGYVGRLERRRVPTALLSALAEVARGWGGQRARFVFRVAGHVGAATRRALVETGLRCEFAGYVSHEQAIDEMRSATLLLVVVPEGIHSDTTIPGKPFEYLASGRPILHVGPEWGQCADLIRACGAGAAVPFDSRRISDALAGYYKKWQDGDTLSGCPTKELAAFDRRHLTRRLVAVLEQAQSRRRARRIPPLGTEPIRGLAHPTSWVSRCHGLGMETRALETEASAAE